MFLRHTHKHHLVDPSPWPLFASISSLFITIGLVLSLHFFQKGPKLLLLGFGVLIIIVSVWWRDIIREGTFQNHHTLPVQRGLRLGMVLFIVSEVMFFFAFFWAFFHSALAPTIWLGCVWPPLGIDYIAPWGIPLLNTAILLTSGATITIVHSAILINDRKTAILAFLATICLAFLFTSLQVYEYFVAPFDISDGIYGSTFYMSTGFHGVHVLVGTIFIIVCLFRFTAHHFTPQQHFGFEAAAWYWHFVDVVWLFLFICIYFWGNSSF